MWIKVHHNKTVRSVCCNIQETLNHKRAAWCYVTVLVITKNDCTLGKCVLVKHFKDISCFNILHACLTLTKFSCLPFIASGSSDFGRCCFDDTSPLSGTTFLTERWLIVRPARDKESECIIRSPKVYESAFMFKLQSCRSVAGKVCVSKQLSGFPLRGSDHRKKSSNSS